jgi:membrane fusion protein, multidrug efflux system
VSSTRTKWAWRIAPLALALLAVGGYGLFARAGGAAQPAAPAAPPRATPVVVAPVRTRDVGVYITGLGSVTPLNTVTVHTRVDGQLLSVKFREGQLVGEGDLLAEIDSKPFEAQLTQYQGQLTRDQALLENARLDLTRYETLAKTDAIPEQQLDTQRSLVRQDEGAVENDRGLLESIRVQLGYCRITSPITGRAGLRQVDPGNIVHAADANGLVVITQLQPIAVIFTIPEDSIPAVLARIARGTPVRVDAYDREQRRKLSSGTLLTIDNQVDPATGTVKLKATFPNTDGRLFSSQFVNARLLLDVKPHATVVPAVAVQRGTGGAFVYVTTPEQTVTVRQVTVGVADGDEVAIDAGLTVGERVVIDGADRLRDGSRVVAQASR